MTVATIDIRRAKAIESPYMSDGELTWLAARAAHAPVIVEIGCANGRSTRALADHCPGVVYAVDHWPMTGPHPRRFDAFKLNLADLIAVERVRPMRMTSLAAADLLPDAFADLVFIDASHRYDAIRADLDAWRPHVKAGGILCGHDYWPSSQPGVRRAVDEAFAGQFTRHADSIWAVQL